MSYARESRALDDELLAVIARWRAGRTLTDGDFDDLALRIFAYQLRYNAPFAQYAASLGYSSRALPASWQAIPPVPAAAFKEATLATFDPATSVLAFETSGTTRGVGGRHYFDTAALYDAALLAGFDAGLRRDGARLRYANFVPNPAERPQSSLGYMMARVSSQFGDGETGWYLRGDELLVDAFVRDAHAACADRQPVCIATTAFALLHLVEALAARGIALQLPPGSRVMETGGFKGRTRSVARAELYAAATDRLGVAPDAIRAEYGMTELTSQYYDADGSLPIERRRKVAPPWLRTRVVGPDGTTLPDGTVGALVHVDLANRGSCVAIATDDLGVRFDDGLVLIGRDAGASLRGCSLDAEDLLPR